MSKDRIDRWTTSTNEEVWNNDDYATREEAIEHAAKDLDLEPGRSFWVGRMVAPHVGIDGDDVVDNLVNQLYDQVGEAAEEQFDCTKAAMADLGARLTAELEKWMLDHQIEVTCFAIENAEQLAYEGVEDVKDVEQKTPEEPVEAK